MELNVEDGNVASREQKIKDFKGLAEQATNISSAFFRSKKGFMLGDKKQKAIKTYGTPDKLSIEKGIEILEWKFIGDIFYDGKTDRQGKPLAKNSFGHQVLMYFRKGKLIAQILVNEIA